MKSLCVMPVYNQEEQLPELLKKCQETMLADHLLIVNNGSSDASLTYIKQSGFDVIELDKNYGIGYALRLGAKRALEEGYDIVVNIAGNGKMLPAEMNRILDPIKNDQADYVTGSRFMEGGHSPHLPLFRRISIPLVVNNIIRILFGVKLTDATNGFRAYSVKLLENANVQWEDRWLDHYQFEYYLYAKALRLGYRCLEVPSSMVYPSNRKNYTKIKPFIGWWEMLQPWIFVGTGIR